MNRGLAPWDVVVIGAGPAGALAARQAAQQGLRVLLVEQARIPRDKTCGCCVSARGLATLADCQLSEHVATLAPRHYDALRLASGGAEARIALPPGITIDRADFDALLTNAAATAGADVLDETRAVLAPVQEPIADPRTLYLVSRRGHSRSVRTRVVIIAAGIAHRVAPDELDAHVAHKASRIGVSAIVDPLGPVPWVDGVVNMAVTRHGYVGAARLPDGRWRIAAALATEDLRAGRHVSTLVRSVLSDAGWSPPAAIDSATWRGTPTLWRQPRRVAGNRLFVIGDAAGYVEPFTGEGIACALDAGRAVADLATMAVTQWSASLAESWSSTVQDDIQRRWRAARMVAHAVRQPVLTTAATALLSRFPRLATPAVAHVHAPRQGAAS